LLHNAGANIYVNVYRLCWRGDAALPSPGPAGKPV